jgi:hypothetical protein
MSIAFELVGHVVSDRTNSVRHAKWLWLAHIVK